MKANKKLGQHFLVNSQTIQSIVGSVPLDLDLLEIGPGPGALTQKLAQRDQGLTLLEKDERFAQKLREFCPQENIFFTDALKSQAKDLGIKEDFWLVSNLPYNIAAPLLLHWSKESQLRGMTVMVQKEMGQRILPELSPRSNMNSLHCLLCIDFEIRLICSVPPDHFDPPPQVDSLVLELTRRQKPLMELQRGPYEKFLRSLFAHRRKNLNNMIKTIGVPGLEHELEKRGISKKQRAETLNLEDILALYERVLTLSKNHP